MENLKYNIIEFCKELGIDLVGFTKCRQFNELENFFKEREKLNLFNEFEEEDIEKRINPNLLMEKGKTIISIAFPYWSEKNNYNNLFSKYTLGMDYHIVIRKYLDKICEYIRTMGGEAEGFVDNNPLPERYIAYLSGVGFIGKNNMLITEKYGSYVFLGEIITDIDIEEDKPIDKNCCDCGLCEKECPNHAIMNNSLFNSNDCMSYITQKKQLEDKELKLIKESVFGCDICQLVCPHNKKIKTSNISELMPTEYMMKANIRDIINLDNKGFKENFKQCACGWRGKNILIRNALIIYKNKYDEDKENIEKNIQSPYIKEYYDRIFKEKNTI